MSNENLVGQKLADNYRVDRFLGEGGMAQVYYGWDESLDRPVAIKVIGNALRTNESFAERFIQEARAVAKWRHENIIQVYYAGEEGDNLYYFVMEYIDGQDLEQILRQYEEKGELIPFEDVIRIGRAVAGALDYAHSKHVIHRDVKPSNIMIDRENRVVLTDFGLAMDTQRGSMGMTFGTPHYVAPEQARNSADAVPQSDFYSLGIILYEMLTGIVPFDDPSSMSVALKHLSEPPPPPRSINPDLSEEVEQVLLKALSKEPSERFDNGTALIDALADALLAQSEKGKQSLVMPPMPSGMAPRQTPPRKPSRTSVFDNVRLSAPMAPPSVATPAYPPPPSEPPLAPQPSVPSAASSGSGSGPNWLLIGGVILIVIIGGFLLFGRGGDEAPAAVVENEPEPTAVAEEAAEEAPTSAPAAPTEEAEEAAVVAQPTEVAVPTESPTEPAAATEAPAVEPTATQPPPPTDLPPTPAPAVAPTLAYPNGQPVELVYNDSSFYLNNQSGQRLRTSSFSFEALDADGRALRWFLLGNRWSQFYSFVDSNNCVGIEPFGPPGSYLRPAQCRDYNSTITPEYDSEETFWLARSGVTEFRVLWDDQEVARCPLGENSCRFNVP
ncbi:MAG: serine/threonine protein kinase [Anaerolineales bacterium]|nr:serine/threonine protein kinase [Anaerolineales bacterium]